MYNMWENNLLLSPTICTPAKVIWPFHVMFPFVNVCKMLKLHLGWGGVVVVRNQSNIIELVTFHDGSDAIVVAFVFIS